MRCQGDSGLGVFSPEPRFYKRVCPSVGPSVGPLVGPLVMLLSAGRNKPANDLFCVYELVLYIKDFVDCFS